MQKDTVFFLAVSLLAALVAGWVCSALPLAAQSRPPVREAAARPGEQPMDISPQAAQSAMRSDPRIVLLDVRTPEEYAEKHIPGSMLVPLAAPEVFGPEFEKRVPDRDAVVYVYCRSGRRSANAVAMLRKLGYKNAYNLGGLNDWPYEVE